VRRCLAIFAALSLFTLQAESLAFHVHGVPDAHHVDDHQHGPAIHHHSDFDSSRHIDEGELSAGGTVITMAVPAATASTPAIVHAVLAERLPIPELRLIGDARAIEMRSHSPPPLRDSFLRGPPSSAHS
jgi:hypothetical protein